MVVKSVVMPTTHSSLIISLLLLYIQGRHVQAACQRWLWLLFKYIFHDKLEVSPMYHILANSTGLLEEGMILK